eukprot:TRINITY_DN1794_c0_g1_i7.p1 TRINITY_DN1794_c0_g1~~TRINITY_DN1794_c0_g1_i7.p1  ORF type:complete len:392 (-),score=76.12 TRINITY_DN1794_c0_g1_i7:96-1271(-)
MVGGGWTLERVVSLSLSLSLSLFLSAKPMDSLKPESFGDSLLVPSVQELGREGMVTVPARYIRPDHDRPIISKIASLQEIPTIDMQKLLLGESVNSELEKLHSACQEWGFFQLANHGVSSTLVENMKFEIQRFFNLPLEEKKTFWQQPGDLEGFGQLFVISEKQKLDWVDMFYMVTLPFHVRKPHLLPKLPQSFRETTEAYSSELQKLAVTLLLQMAGALEMDIKEMIELFEDGSQSMRMNYYPPCPQPELVMGLTPHSDSSGLTILLEVNEVEGLQIRKQGQWIPVKPLPNAFIVNVGDTLEILSNGVYRSIEHRATTNSTKERLSIATFYGANLEGEIGPAPSLINPQNPALFKRITTKEFRKGFFSKKLNGKSNLKNMRIENGEGNIA